MINSYRNQCRSYCWHASYCNRPLQI